MPDPKKAKSQKPSPADQFSDEEMNQIKHYGQMLGGGVTPFDEAVEEALNKREAGEAAAQSLGPSAMDQAAVKQRGAIQQQAAAQGAVQAAQAQAAQPSPEPPPAPAGPQGATAPFAAQKGFTGGAGNAPKPAQAATPQPPAEGEEEESDPSTQWPPN